MTMKLCNHLLRASVMPKAQVSRGMQYFLPQAALLALHIQPPCLCRAPRVAVGRVAVVLAAWRSISTTLPRVIFVYILHKANIVLSIAFIRRHCPISSTVCSCRHQIFMLHEGVLGSNCITGWVLHCDCGRPGELLQRLQPRPRYTPWNPIGMVLSIKLGQGQALKAMTSDSQGPPFSRN